MSEELQAIFHLEHIFKLCADKNQPGDSNLGVLVNTSSYNDSWNAFYKWIKGQLDLGRTVNVPNFGTLSIRQLEEKEHYIHINLNENFLNHHGLVFKSTLPEIKQPTIKLNLSVTAKLVENMDPQIVGVALNRIIGAIGDILANYESVEVNLGQLGKLSALNREVIFTPALKTKITNVQNKQTVKALLDSNIAGKIGYTTRRGEEERTHQEAQKKNGQNSGMEDDSRIKNEKSLGLSPIRKVREPFLGSTGKSKIISHNQSFLSPTKKQLKIEALTEMLGAGTDPLAKNQDYSHLTSHPKELMNARFVKPPNAKVRLPPVIDTFARTIAAPISHTKFSFSVSGRIASNYTPTTKYLHIEYESKVIKFIKPKESKIQLTASPEFLEEPATEDEELFFILNEDRRTIQLQKKVKARATSYNRYRQYVLSEIPVDCIAPIRQYWINDILDLIPAEYPYLDRSTVESLIDKMLNEINRDYYDSGRKAILDYVLKEEDERLRLGITQILNPPLDYGENIYLGLEPDDEWKETVNLSRNEISDRLVICSECTLTFKNIWSEYEPKHFLSLPTKEDPPMTIEEFIKNQNSRLAEVKAALTGTWMKAIQDIYKAEIHQMNKKQAYIFFESNATLMANQLRILITNSILEYREFFRRFEKKKQDYKMPQQIIQEEKDPKTPIEDVFLVVKLDCDEKKPISFNDNLQSIRSELLKLIENIVYVSHGFYRAENTIARSEKMFLWPVTLEDLVIQNATKEIEIIINDNIECIEHVLEIFEKYAFLLHEEDVVQSFIEGKHTRKEYQAEINKYEQTYKALNQEIPFYIRMSMILIDCTEVKKKLLAICQKMIRKLLKAIHNYIHDQAGCITNEYNRIIEEISGKAETVEKLVELEANLEKVRKVKYNEITTSFKDLTEWLFMLYSTNHKISESDLSRISQTSDQVKRIMEEVNNNEDRIRKERDDLEAKLRKRKHEFSDNLDKIVAQIDRLKEFSSPLQSKDANDIIDALNKTLNDYQAEMNDINQKEELIGWQPTEFPKLAEAVAALKPYDQLWKLVKNFQTYHSQWTKEKVIFKLDPEFVEKETKMMLSTARKMTTAFTKATPHPLSIANKMLQEITAFSQHIPLVRCLCNPGLNKPYHWEEISAIGEYPMTRDKEVYLKTLIELEFYTKLPKLEEISDFASKEYTNEKILEKMKNDWAEIVCELKPWKDTGTFAVSGNTVDEVQQLLDDQMVKTQTMKGSPYAKRFENEIKEWEEWLKYTQDVFEYWVKVQSVWLYLEPVFASEDIMKQMPTEGNKFREVDASWKFVMSKINANPKVTEVMKNKKLLDTFKEAHEALDQVQKGLNDYLETKRKAFPRFYFLSSEELLEILSETKDPTRVQPHLKKCFEGINKIQFDELKKIHGMYSSEGEYVPFVNEIDAMAARGAVEQWLIQVEDAMVVSVREVIEKSFEDYPKKKRSDWVLNRCGQSVLTVSMTYWTYETERAIKEKGAQGLKEYLVTCENMIEDIVQLVRKDIKPLDRLTLEALIVLDVHNKDVVKELALAGVTEITDFGWTSQLRYYWEDANTVVRIINAQLKYNYEYLGNSPRLVITPLTDRCYRTLCGAINLNYGGAPEGPAGTGKTETVKDLAKALARQCVVFNCSDGLDYKAMGKFFKGLASSGAWSCFDEFNRIDLEVLSVVAQQILCIQIAIREKKSSFDFEDSHIKLKLTANCFITMNPGYAGRSELPDNLKALFRSVAMMVPDYALIAQISLYSFGFSDAENLARKIVTTYKLCSEQLSSQSHYDYGMRAVKSVLTAAGNLLRKYPNEKENILILRAIKDVNLAKFLSFDIPLFKGITSDLFPGVELPEIDYSAMIEAIHNQAKTHKLQSVDYFIEKIIQLYEMILVRHGLMVVGLPFAGKTSAIKILAAALTELNEKKLMGEKKVQIAIINPKSIDMKLLYGYNDEVTHEWTDGVLAVKFRNFAKSETEDRKWLIFDGPVDAVWIENMNTVLDDNKKLCLNSGEIIAMSKVMNMMFEPMDLLAASPATVSRCGMIYMEPQGIGWRPMFEIWKDNYLPKTFKEEDISEINYLFETFVDPMLHYHRKALIESSPTQDQNLVQSLMRILACLLEPFNDENYFNNMEFKTRMNIIDYQFLFAMTWSMGGSLATESRKQFDIYLKKLTNGDVPEVKLKKKLSLPDRGNIFDFKFRVSENRPEGEWIPWVDLLDPNETISARQLAQEIIVKTSDTLRYSFLLHMFIKNDIAALFCGPTGTGKSVYTKNVIFNELSKEKYMVIDLAYSAQTKAFQAQDVIDNALTKRKKGYYGPPVGKKCVIFVDDLNMPAKEKWGAQPPIEILRQMIDQGGWYDFKEKERPFKNIVDITFVSAMGLPGGGRTFITPRLLRHLNLVSFTSFDDDTMNRIFSTILHWYLSNNNFPAELIKIENKVVFGTIEVYKTVLKELRPTPTKSHYLFNLRDFAKVIFGICMADKERIQTMDHMIRLWTHEVWRVFGDRLIADEDKMLLLRSVKDIVRRTFGANFDNIFSHLDKNGDGKVDQLDEIRALMFTDIMTATQVKKYYEEVLDYTKLQQSIENSLQNYNFTTDKPMDLVLFSFAVEHLVIISRILKQPGGNALLIGVGGSGRQSLTRLAAHIMEYDVKQIELSKNYGKNEWRDDIKAILKNAGGKGNHTVFLFTDSQIKDESFVEDINTLLNSGEVPNLYAPDEKAEIMELVRPMSRTEGKASDGTPAQLFAYFVERVKKMLHIVLCFSPIGEGLRTRIRNFPSLVNCCTIDWFSAWPSDALYSVAKKFAAEIEMESSVRDKCVDMLQHFHESTISWSNEFYTKLKRKYYVTPTSFLEMIITFKNLLAEKRKEVKANKNKYDNGYEKIIVTEKSVEKMQQSLTDLQPKLKKAAEDTALKLQQVTIQKEEADRVKAIVSVDEEAAQRAMDEATAIKEECETELNKALPALRAAEDALKVLKKQDLDEVKKYTIPPNPVKLTCQAVLMLTKKVKVERKPNPKTGEMEWQWWEASVKMLNESDFLQFLIDFKDNIDNVDEASVKKLGDFIRENKEALEPNNVKNSSSAAYCLIKWVLGVYDFYFVNKEVRPKKERLAKAQAEVDKSNATLAIKQKELKVIIDKVDALTRELNEAERNKHRLEMEYEDVSKKLVRAKKLIESLGGEKGRWKELGTILEGVYNTLTGDVLVASGMIAYLGAFTAAFRVKITEQWVKRCKENNIPSSEVFSLQAVLGDPVQIRSWNIDGLPSDSFSIENGIIISKARRWPLCIDPQGQANKWIKNMEKSRKISVIKLSDPDFLRTLENAIQFGNPVLLENVLEELDPSLEPILLKQTFKKGNTLYIKLGDQTIEYMPTFSFYITTKLRNPHYMPELSTKVTLLNFMITLEGLNDQLLGILVKKEKPELEQEKERLILESASNKKQLQEIEEKILEVLSGEKNILEDETAINILTASKNTSNEISEKQKIAEVTEKEIDEARKGYAPVSNEASCLFFAISDLANIDPMYQYSLVYFIDLFTQSILKSEQSNMLERRLKNLRTYFLYSLYSNICRSLFEKDKLLFSFLLAVRLKEFKGELDSDMYRFLLTGGVSLGEKVPPKPADWISDKAWAEINRLSKLQGFENLAMNIQERPDEWQVIYDSPTPHLVPLPDPFEKDLSKFQKLLVLRCIRPDKMVPSIQDFVKEELGPEFIDPPAFDLAKIYKDSSCVTPLIFVLSPGSDPFTSLSKFAEINHKAITPISLGQGRGPIAAKAIAEGVQNGSWVVLQNCHLAVRWMPTLERICEEFSQDKTHPEFRLWLTSYPSPDFPISILQNGVKMTNEPPKGLKSNLTRSYLTDPISDRNFFESCQRPREWRKLLFGLCFFHAVIQERRKFGPLGWNIPYEFNESDLRICVMQLKMFLDEYPNKVPFDALKYLTAECNYGGRVTDDKDRRLISTLLNDYYCDEIINDDNYRFTKVPYFKAPPIADYEEVMEVIKNYPLNVEPEVFGLHANADITKDLGETNLLLDSLLLCQADTGGKESSSQDDTLNKLVDTILSDFPDVFDLNKAKEKYPVVYKESMNTVLTQELERFNILIKVIRTSLNDIKLALKGFIIMSSQLERATKSLFDNKVPELWMEKSYPSLKPLGGYVKDLKDRLKFFQTWIDEGAPLVFWLSGFYFTQSFLTGVLQNYARKETIAIDEIQFDFEFFKEEVKEKPVDGAYVNGLFLEGAKWNFDTMLLDESDPKTLFVKCPTILLKPTHFKRLTQYPHYDCPVYKTSARRGVLSTTGHSTNFVMWIRLPSDQPQSHWIKRGVALLTQLDD